MLISDNNVFTIQMINTYWPTIGLPVWPRLSCVQKLFIYYKSFSLTISAPAFTPVLPLCPSLLVVTSEIFAAGVLVASFPRVVLPSDVVLTKDNRGYIFFPGSQT